MAAKKVTTNKTTALFFSLNNHTCILASPEKVYEMLGVIGSPFYPIFINVFKGGLVCKSDTFLNAIE